VPYIHAQTPGPGEKEGPMRSLTLILAALAAVSAAPTFAGLADLENAIGLYVDVPSDVDGAFRLAYYEGDPGTFEVYVVLTNPYNENTGRPINLVGGIEFQLVMPSNVYLLDAVFPGNSFNFLSPPEFFVNFASGVPVYGDIGTITTLTLGEFMGTGGEIFLAPVSQVSPSIPGALAVADYDDDFSLSEAVPSSGNFDFPVFCVFCQQNAEDRTWGDVKSLYH